MWDLGPGSEGRLSPQAQTLPGGHSDYVLSVCFSQDGKFIISGSKDRSVTIWDAKLMKKVCTLRVPSSYGVMGVVWESADECGWIREIHTIQFGDRLSARTWEWRNKCVRRNQKISIGEIMCSENRGEGVTVVFFTACMFLVLTDEASCRSKITHLLSVFVLFVAKMPNWVLRRRL